MGFFDFLDGMKKKLQTGGQSETPAAEGIPSGYGEAPEGQAEASVADDGRVEEVTTDVNPGDLGEADFNSQEQHQ